jgi:hypothetical protein
LLNTRTLKRINERPRKAKLLPLAGAGAGAVALGVALLALAPSPLIALAAVPVGALAVFVVYRAVKARGVTTLDYNRLSGEVAARFSTVREALEALASSEALWRLSDGAGRMSGASNVASAPERTPVRVGQLDTPGIRAGVPVWGIEGGGESLMFLPDALLVYRDDHYEGISYRSVRVDLSFVRFFEKEGVPQDAEVVEFPRRTGERLYSYGAAPRIPVVLYGLVEIALPGNHEVCLQVSSLEAAARFAGAFGAKEPQQERDRAYKPPAVETRVKWALEVLGVEEDASMRKITAAYRKLARTYHPDKVLELPAEAREISERRMKEINAAYSELKRRAGTPRGSDESYSPADTIHRSS